MHPARQGACNRDGLDPHCHLINHNYVIDQQPDAIIHRRRKHIRARAKVKAALPVRREIVGSHAGIRRAKAPVEIEIGIIALEHDRATAVDTVVITPDPGVVFHLPRNADPGVAGGFVVIHPNQMAAFGDRLVKDACACATVKPLIQHQRAIKIHACAIVHSHGELIVIRRLEVFVAGPTGREIIDRDARRRRTGLPIKI